MPETSDLGHWHRGSSSWRWVWEENCFGRVKCVVPVNLSSGGYVTCGLVYLNLKVQGGIRVGVTSVGIFSISALLNPGARTESQGGACKESRRLKTEPTSRGWEEDEGAAREAQGKPTNHTPESQGKGIERRAWRTALRVFGWINKEGRRVLGFDKVDLLVMLTRALSMNNGSRWWLNRCIEKEGRRSTQCL